MHHEKKRLFERIDDLGGHAHHDAQQIFKPLRQCQRQVDAAADAHGAMADATHRGGVGHQAIG